MSYNAEGLKEIAMMNKRSLKNKFFNIPVKDYVYKFKVSGVGSRSIKIEKFFYYSEIMKAVNEGNKDGFEYEIKQTIAGSEVIGTTNELRELALAKKTKLKNEFVDLYLGRKFYEFRIAGIGFKSVKIEMYMGYDDIINEVSSNNPRRLELILMELIIGDKIDFDEYQKNEIEDSKTKINSKVNKEIDDVDTSKLDKLSEEEFDEIIVNVKGWQKLVLDSIDDIIDEKFTLDMLLNQKRILSYQTRGDDLKAIVLENLNHLIDLGLVLKVNKTTYVKLWN